MSSIVWPRGKHEPPDEHENDLLFLALFLSWSLHPSVPSPFNLFSSPMNSTRVRWCFLPYGPGLCSQVKLFVCASHDKTDTEGNDTGVNRTSGETRLKNYEAIVNNFFNTLFFFDSKFFRKCKVYKVPNLKKKPLKLNTLLVLRRNYNP